MGILDYFRSLKTKAQDATVEKVLERMRDMKVPIAEKKIAQMLATHVEVLPGVKSASVDLSREGLGIKVTFRDERPTLRRQLKFVALVWTSHKRAFVFAPVEPFDYQKDQITYACVVTALATVLQQVMGFTKEKLAEAKFSTEVGFVSGVIEKDGQLHYDIRRVPLLRQYAHFRVMGQAPLEHLNVTDCWIEGGRFMVRIDNNRIVDQIKSMNLDAGALRKMAKGDYSDFTGEKEEGEA